MTPKTVSELMAQAASDAMNRTEAALSKPRPRKFRPRRHPRSIEVETTVDLRDMEFTVKATYIAGTSDYYSKSFGNWLPGDPDEFDVDSIQYADENGCLFSIDYVDLDRDERATVDDAVMDAALRYAADYDAAAEDFARRENWED